MEREKVCKLIENINSISEDRVDFDEAYVEKVGELIDYVIEDLESFISAQRGEASLILNDINLTLNFSTNIEAEYENGEYLYEEGPPLSVDNILKIPEKIRAFIYSKDIKVFS